MNLQSLTVEKLRSMKLIIVVCLVGLLLSVIPSCADAIGYNPSSMDSDSTHRTARYQDSFGAGDGAQVTTFHSADNNYDEDLYSNERSLHAYE